jgi:hypothetical protein
MSAEASPAPAISKRCSKGWNVSAAWKVLSICARIKTVASLHPGALFPCRCMLTTVGVALLICWYVDPNFSGLPAIAIASTNCTDCTSS